MEKSPMDKSEKKFDLSAEGVTIDVDGVELTCYRDGSVEKVDGRTGELVRQFGTSDAKGYKVIGINGKGLGVHRLIHEAFSESWEPTFNVDHISGVKDDNRPENLRQFETLSEHLRQHQDKRANCSSKYRFVCWNKINKRWHVQLFVNGKRIHGGYFEDEIEAARAADVLAEKLGYGERAFNRTNHTEV